jgi:nucleoside-diphosphate-sugar epimerase
METVLITGGTGMIGKALTQALIERGHNANLLTRYLLLLFNHDLIDKFGNG